MAVAVGRRAAAAPAVTKPGVAVAPPPTLPTAPPPVDEERWRRSSSPPRLLPIPELERIIQRPGGLGPREVRLLTSQIMLIAAAAGEAPGEREREASPPPPPRPWPLPPPKTTASAPNPNPTGWRRLSALFDAFSRVLNPVHISALLTALPRAIAAAPDDPLSRSAAAARDLLYLSDDLMELAAARLPTQGGGSRELVACACGCARLWGKAGAFSSSPFLASSPSPPSAKRLMQLVAARARPMFLLDAELAALGWAVSETAGFAPPPRAFVADYAKATHRRLFDMRPKELLQVGRALALMAAAADADSSGRRADICSSSSPSMVPPSWVDAFARACEYHAATMDARDVAGAMWAAAALARQKQSPSPPLPPPLPHSAAALPAMTSALLLRAVEIASDLELRHIVVMLWACGAFAAAGVAAEDAPSPPCSFHAPTLLPRSWRRFEARVLDGRWPELLLWGRGSSSSSPARELKRAAVALVASARLGLAVDAVAAADGAEEEEEEEEDQCDDDRGARPLPQFRAATLAAAREGLDAAAAYLALRPDAEAEEEEEDFGESSSTGYDSSGGGGSRSPSPPAPAARRTSGGGGGGGGGGTNKKPRPPARSLLRDASSVLWSLQRDHAARVAAAGQQQQQQQQEQPPPPLQQQQQQQQQEPHPSPPELLLLPYEAATARAAATALSEALARRQWWTARQRRRPKTERFFGRDGRMLTPPVDLQPADLSVSLWSLARLGLLDPQLDDDEEEEEQQEPQSAFGGGPSGGPADNNNANNSHNTSPRRRLLRDAVAEAEEMLLLFGARETAGLLLSFARARHREPWAERALHPLASLRPPHAAHVASRSKGVSPCYTPSFRPPMRPPRPPSPRDLAAAIYGAGAALRRDPGAGAGRAAEPPPSWALRRLALASRAALPACGAPELVMLLRGFAALRWHPGPAWVAAHARRCMEVAAGGGGGSRGFSAAETAALQRAARWLHSVRPTLLDSVDEAE